MNRRFYTRKPDIPRREKTSSAEPRALVEPYSNGLYSEEFMDTMARFVAKACWDTRERSRKQSLDDIDKALVPIRQSIAKLDGTIEALTKLFGMKADEIGNLKGEPGPQGEQGPQGERGLRGAPGRDGRDGMDAPVINGLTFDSQDGTFVFRMDDGTRGPAISLFDIFGDIKIDRASFSIIVKTVSGGELLRLPLRDLFEQYDDQRRGAG
jgi:hypothetical protein